MDSTNKSVTARIVAAKRKSAAPPASVKLQDGIQAQRYLRVKNSGDKAAYAAFLASASQDEKASLSAYLSAFNKKMGAIERAALFKIGGVPGSRSAKHNTYSVEIGRHIRVGDVVTTLPGTHVKGLSRNKKRIGKIEAFCRGASTIFDVSGAGTTAHVVNVPPDATITSTNQRFAESISALSKDFLTAFRQRR